MTLKYLIAFITQFNMIVHNDIKPHINMKIEKVLVIRTIWEAKKKTDITGERRRLRTSEF